MLPGMSPVLLSILIPVVLGAVIGWFTNWIALKMLFHPRRRRWGFQGLLPRRQAELARDVGRIVGTELVKVDELLAPLDRLDLAPQLTALLDQALTRKITELRAKPLVGMLLTDGLVQGFRDSILKEVLAAQPQIIANLKAAARPHLDVSTLAEQQLASFDLDRLERLINQLASTEFRAIEWWGAVLGGMIGLLQALSMLALR